jgi:predicted  nucleic acid-binding Zn-ribbon protein
MKVNKTNLYQTFFNFSENTAVKNNSAPKKEVEYKDLVKEIISEKRLNDIHNKIKEIENNFSITQVYLEALKKSEKIFIGNKNIQDLYLELKNLIENSKFKGKFLLENIIPVEKDYYNSNSNINNLISKIREEISKTENLQNNLKEEIKKLNITLENITAQGSVINKDMFKNIKLDNLYKNLKNEKILFLLA